MPDYRPILKCGHHDRPGHTFVAELQEALNHRAEFSLLVDGHFGKDTERAVLVFQGQNPRCGPVDGIVGIKTYEALGLVTPTVVEASEDETSLSDAWMSDFRKIMLRWSFVWWLLMPMFVVGVPMLNAWRDGHVPHGSGWIPFALIWGVFGVIWVMMFRVGILMRRVFVTQDQDADIARRARIARAKMDIAKADRQERATERLRKIQQRQQAEESHRLALDIDKIRRSLDTNPENDDG